MVKSEQKNSVQMKMQAGRGTELDSNAPSVRFITMGCAKNEVDTDNMRASAIAAGFIALGETDLARADIVVINTCSFITDATAESIDAILELVDNTSGKSSRSLDVNSKVVVTGCMPARYEDSLEEEIPEVDAFLPVAREGELVEVLCNLTGFKASSQKPAVLRTIQAPFAYVKISDGCDRFCAFCTIPYIRGRYASRTAAEIIEEVSDLVSRGTKEIILIGQDTGIWGTDFCDSEQYSPLAQPALSALMDHLANEFCSTWIRVMYMQPEGVNNELLEVINFHENICSYLDIPLQHANKKVIGEMNRRGDGQTYLEMVNNIREKINDVTLRTTMIAGFPGESEDEFYEMVDFIEDASFDYAGVFGYSCEEGTEAGNRPDQVDNQIIAARAQELTDIAEQIGFIRAQKRIGNVYDVLVCGLQDSKEEEVLSNFSGREDMVWGRSKFQAPDVDGIIMFKASVSSLGQIVRVKITGAFGFDFEGELIEEK